MSAPVVVSKTARRFWAKVNKTEGCWEWTGSTTARGYGHFHLGGTVHRAPRVSWLLRYGEWPTVHVLHRCDNPRCVRPEHLFLGTDADNVADMIAKGRKRVATGSRNGLARLTETQVVEVRARLLAGANHCQLGREYGVNRTAIRDIAIGKTWRHVRSEP